MEDFHVAVPNVQEEHRSVKTETTMSFFGVIHELLVIWLGLFGICKCG